MSGAQDQKLREMPGYFRHFMSCLSESGNLYPFREMPDCKVCL